MWEEQGGNSEAAPRARIQPRERIFGRLVSGLSRFCLKICSIDSNFIVLIHVQVSFASWICFD